MLLVSEYIEKTFKTALIKYALTDSVSYSDSNATFFQDFFLGSLKVAIHSYGIYEEAINKTTLTKNSSLA